MQLQRPSLIMDQRQKLSPQMIQSIKIMALPVLELKAQITEELESNPALEIIKDTRSLSLERLSEIAEPVPEVYENSSDSGFVTRSYHRDTSKQSFIEGTKTQPKTLHDYLLEQLHMQKLDSEERELGEMLIENLNDDGFHIEDPLTLCAQYPKERIEKLIGIIRNLEPVGTCCVDFRESLLFQASIHPKAPPYVAEVIKRHFGFQEGGGEIRKRMRIKESQLAAALHFIKGLSPFPGRAYSTQVTRYIIPDVFVKWQEDELVIKINEEVLPVLGISKPIMKMAEDPVTSSHKEAHTYVKENIKKAQFFINSIEQRTNTLYKVTQCIVHFQKEFFKYGPTWLSPLTLKEVANEIDKHETTVSRIVNNKYMQTDWGIFELRYFFSNSVGTTPHAGSAKEAVKAVLKEIIEKEDSSLSDKELVTLLRARGIEVARRTVAKYRSELHEPNSHGRNKD